MLAQALMFLQGLTGSYGLAIILLTVAVRVLLLPLTIKQVRSMKKMQHLQPKIKEIQHKHKNDKKKQQEEQMKLITEHGFNPLGGCLPLVLQMPFFFALFRILGHRTQEILLEQKANLYVMYTIGKDLMGTKGAFWGMQLGGSMASIAGATKFTMAGVVKVLGAIPHNIPHAILIAFMIGSQFFYSKAMGGKSQEGSQASMAHMMMIMFAVFAAIFPAGLLLYWTTTNLIGILEHYLIERFTPSPEPVKQGA